jgi:hypothetical protein
MTAGALILGILNQGVLIEDYFSASADAGSVC